MKIFLILFCVLIFTSYSHGQQTLDPKKKIETIENLKAGIAGTTDLIEKLKNLPNKQFSEAVSVLDLDMLKPEVRKAADRYDLALYAAEQYVKDPSKTTPKDLEVIKKNLGDSTLEVMLFKEQAIKGFEAVLSDLQRQLHELEKNP